MATKKKSPEETTAPTARKSPAKKAAAKKSVKAAGAAAGAPAVETSQVQPSPVELQEEIRLRAYQIYCERGGEHGLHDADWHRAELEVRAKYDK